jgi:sulfatase maturation enzyme AslB (radical SAM superfamily)
LLSKINYITNKALSHIYNHPIYLILFVSDNCPNKCTHCWYNNGWKDTNIKGNNLSNDEIIAISKHIPRLKFLSLTGGEAFLRYGIEDIISAFKKNSDIDRYDIPTSGFNNELIAMKTHNILNILNYTPFRVDVSLDGPEHIHNKIRKNNAAFSNAIKTISILHEIKTNSLTSMFRLSQQYQNITATLSMN